MLESKQQGTTNQKTYLKAKHGIEEKKENSSTKRTILDLLQQPEIPLRVSAEEALCNWVIDTFQLFTVVESPSFQQMFLSHNCQLPIRNADTLCKRITTRYSSTRYTLIEELKQTCSTVLLLLDR
jgi:hypothetical protein